MYLVLGSFADGFQLQGYALLLLQGADSLDTLIGVGRKWQRVWIEFKVQKMGANQPQEQVLRWSKTPEMAVEGSLVTGRKAAQAIPLRGRDAVIELEGCRPTGAVLTKVQKKSRLAVQAHSNHMAIT